MINSDVYGLHRIQMNEEILNVYNMNVSLGWWRRRLDQPREDTIFILLNECLLIKTFSVNEYSLSMNTMNRKKT